MNTKFRMSLTLGDGMGKRHTGTGAKVMVMVYFLHWEISSWVFNICFIFQIY